MSHLHTPKWVKAIFTLMQIGALVLTSLLAATQPASAASSNASSSLIPTSLIPTPLSMVQVAAPDINCVFDTDCTITVDDMADHFLPPGIAGDAFLQSRNFPVGEAGTQAEGLYGYLYRIDMRNAVGVLEGACTTQFRVNFGPIVPLDYNKDGIKEHIFVVTEGGLGNIQPTSVEQDGDELVVGFGPAVCTGAHEGDGDSSFFFGLTSQMPHQTVKATLKGMVVWEQAIQARAPKRESRPAGSVAYVYDADTATAAAFESFLLSEGYALDLIQLNDVLATDFSHYRMILIADDTGKLSEWGNAATQADHIAKAQRPVIGLGEGGYAYFGQHALHIGWGNGWHGTQKAVIGNPALAYYQTPYDLTGLLAGPLDLYTEAVNEIGIHTPSPVANVILQGREPTDDAHYSLIAQMGKQVCDQLWGFSGNPRAMTDEGRMLFANAMRYGLGGCPSVPQIEQPTPREPEWPVFNPKEQIRFEIEQSDNQTFRAQVHFPQPQMWPVKGPEGQAFMELAVPGVDIDSGPAGQPGVPVVRRILAIPHGAKVVVKEIKPAVYNEQQVLLYPVQPEPVDAVHPQRTSGAEVPGDEKPDPSLYMDLPFTLDKEAYASTQPFPAEVVSVAHLGQMRDLEIVQVSIATGQYMPAKQHLTLFESVALEIVYEGGADGFLPDTRQGNPFDDLLPLYDLALNREALHKYRFTAEFLRPICIGHEYLIITDPTFRPAADTLRTWKVQKGISTRVVETGTGVGTTKEEIRDYIRKQYTNCLVRPSYVLLLGDAEFINPFYRDTKGTDLDYALMDNADILPDLALGRIPVDTLAQAETVINKIVNYEKKPPFAPAYYQNLSFAAYFQCCRNDVAQDGQAVRSFLETSELVRGQLMGNGYNVERIYTTDTTYESAYANAGRDTTPRRYRNGALLPGDIGAGSGFAWDGDTADVVDAFNGGRFLVFHRDHGWSGGWSDPSFTTSDLVSLTNTSQPSVVYSVNCSSGFFDNETSGGNASGVYWAEQLLRMEGGAAGIIGDTRVSPTWANSALSRGLFDATWPNVLPADGGATSIRRLGDILNYGKAYLAGQVGVAQTAGSVSQGSANTDIILYHVYGDPTMELWTGYPYRIKLPRFYELVKFDPTIWEIRYPVEGAQITALLDGEPMARATVINGMATLKLIGDAPAKPLQLSASHPLAIDTALGETSATGTANPQQGGGLSHAALGLALQFPAGAVETPVKLALSELPELDAGPQMTDVVIYNAFSLNAVDEAGELVEHFGQMYDLRLDYSDEQLAERGLDENSLHCVYLDEDENLWKPVDSQVDAANNQVLCRADHFTDFALVGSAQAMAEQPAEEQPAEEQPVEQPNGVKQTIFLPVMKR